MGIVIENGTGDGGYSTKVDKNGMLWSRSIINSVDCYNNAANGVYYDIPISVTTTENGFFFYLKNDSETSMWTSDLEFHSNGNTKLVLYFNVEGAPDGDNITPVNYNLGSGKEATGNFKFGNPITGLTGGLLAKRMQVIGNQKTMSFLPSDRIIIPRGGNIAIMALTAEVELDMNLSIFYESIW